MITTLAGPQGCAWPGDVIDVSEKEAEQMVRGGYANLVDPPGGGKPDVDAPVQAPPKSRKRGR